MLQLKGEYRHIQSLVSSELIRPSGANIRLHMLLQCFVRITLRNYESWYELNGSVFT